MNKLLWADWVALILVTVGALNWGLVGLFDFNLVAELFGDDSVLTNIIYVLVGLAGIFLAADLARHTLGRTTHSE